MRAIEHGRQDMSGQGHQVFADELKRFAAEIADARWAAIADRLTAPLRVAVSGRRGVGRRTVAHALARASVAVTALPQADLDVYVIAEVVKPEDRDAIAALPQPVLAVLNKADLTGPSAAALGGLRVEPMVGLLAVAALDDLLDDTLWAALQVLATRPADLNSPDSFVVGEHPVPVEVRRRLLDVLDRFGITAAVAAIRRGATPAETRAVLRHLSCIDGLVDKIGIVGAQVYYRRVLDAVTELETLSVTDPRAGQFLSRDDTVLARMAAAVDVVEAAGMHVDRCDNAAAYLRRAVGWQGYSRGPVAGMHRACSADIVRGSLRLWSKVGRSA
jgi:hypothetical protein